MSEYIKKSDIKDRIQKEIDNLIFWGCVNTAHALETRCLLVMDDVPTADVKPVVRAKWFDDFTSDWVCTNCLQPSPSKRYKYCPNCGAEMEAVE